MPDLMALAERVEAATGADTELSTAIALAVGWRCEVMKRPGSPARTLWWEPGAAEGFLRGPEHYTASLDAAMTLVPDGATWTLLSADPNEGEPDGPQLPFCTVATLVDAYHATGASPALALTAAALRARIDNGK